MKRVRVLSLFAAALAAAAAVPAGVSARELVRFEQPGARPGTIVVRTGERKLYLVTRPGEAIRYTVAVGKPGSSGSA